MLNEHYNLYGNNNEALHLLTVHRNCKHFLTVKEISTHDNPQDFAVFVDGFHSSCLCTGLFARSLHRGQQVRSEAERDATSGRALGHEPDLVRSMFSVFRGIAPIMTALSLIMNLTFVLQLGFAPL